MSRDEMKRSVNRSPGMPIVISAAPAALVTLIGVLGLVFQTNPIRPYSAGAWAPSDLVGLLIVGVVVGVLSRSVGGLVGTIVGATAALAIQLFVLTEQASHTVNVVASLGEPGWSGQVLAALGVGIASLVGGYVVGALAGRALAGARSPAASTREVVAVGLTLVGAAVLALGLVRAAATSAYVAAESQPVLRVTVEGDRIVTVTPEALPVGRMLLEIQRARGTLERWVSLEGPLPPEMEAVLAAGNDPLMGGGGMLFPASGEVLLRTQRLDLPPGPYAIVVSSGYPEIGPTDTELPPVPALDIRRISVVGPEPATTRAVTGGPIVMLGYVFGLGVVGWGTAGTLILLRRGRSRTAAVAAGAVAVVVMWLVVGLTIGQSHSPF